MASKLNAFEELRAYSVHVCVLDGARGYFETLRSYKHFIRGFLWHWFRLLVKYLQQETHLHC